MTSTPSFDDLFERRLAYPDPDARSRLDRLVGLDAHKGRLTKILGVLVNPSGLQEWAEQHHPGAGTVLTKLVHRPPLVVLAGDVGAGKTELATSIGDAVARQENIDVFLLPLSLATRGQGRVGEMTQLIAAAFDHTIDEAGRMAAKGGPARGAVILLVDEADALAQSRETEQMHHEDRAGVNAFIRGVDRLYASGLPAAVIMCTNRLAALDPAVKRRAADVLEFSRPDDEQRRALLEPLLQELSFTPAELEAMVAATGPGRARSFGFTFSDIVQRLLPTIVLDAYPTSRVTPTRAIEVAGSLAPTPPFRDGADR